MKKLYVASPRGFCAGVRRALETVGKACSQWSGTVYILHEIVHNEFVVEKLRRHGVIMVEDIREVPEESLVIFSAHGVSPQVEEEAARRRLKVIDATCPLVEKIHRKAAELSHCGYRVFLIGHRNHPEIQGTLGRLKMPATVIETTADVATAAATMSIPEKTAFLTQTTLSTTDTAHIAAELERCFPGIKGETDICYATANRQNAVRQLAGCCDTIFIVGSPKSSNSNRLRETAVQEGVRAFLVRTADDVTPDMLDHAQCIGISAGASAPETLVMALCRYLCRAGWQPPETLVCVEEKINFSLPEWSFQRGRER
ncbi:MAG: 4-hydroxy-3-methylbut-2-enyl diphosphate reductase [Victivallales bacterium]|nr:4-hydroxy-3-methylbut-2-enyl diphosphate reductase [Victivallales bacterium]